MRQIRDLPVDIAWELALHEVWISRRGGRPANLRDYNLRDSNLSGANLSYSDLSGANLSDSNLSFSNLRDSNLRGSNLSGANLSGSNLCGANLSDCVGGVLVRMDMGGWSVCVRTTHTDIGCQHQRNADWLRWTPDDVAHMAVGAWEWWQAHGDLVRAAIRDVQARA